MAALIRRSELHEVIRIGRRHGPLVVAVRNQDWKDKKREAAFDARISAYQHLVRRSPSSLPQDWQQ
jgi:hypothetical protein